MRIIIDANIIMAALLGSRGTLIILTSQNHVFYAPSWMIEEVKGYKDFICECVEISKEEFEINLEALLKFIKVMKSSGYEIFLKKAKEAIGQRDIKDVDYLACALAVGADFIWSNDKDFSEQSLIPVKTTEKFIEDGKSLSNF